MLLAVGLSDVQNWVELRMSMRMLCSLCAIMDQGERVIFAGIVLHIINIIHLMQG